MSARLPVVPAAATCAMAKASAQARRTTLHPGLGDPPVLASCTAQWAVSSMSEARAQALRTGQRRGRWTAPSWLRYSGLAPTCAKAWRTALATARTQCRGLGGCRSWTYHANGGICYLHGTVGTPQLVPGAVSGTPHGPAPQPAAPPPPPNQRLDQRPNRRRCTRSSW